MMMVGGARKRRLLLFVICCLQLWSVPPTWAAVSTSLFHCDDHIEACRCQGDYIVQCIAGNFHHVPIFSPFLTKLNLTKNKIEQLNGSSFRHLSMLRLLDLSWNRIVTIDNHVFSGLGRLEVLALESNRIGYIRKEAFKNLHELIELRLHGNPMKTLEGDVFFDLPKLDKLTFYDEHDGKAKLCRCQHSNVQTFAFCSSLKDVHFETNIKDNCLLKSNHAESIPKQQHQQIPKQVPPKASQQLKKTGSSPVFESTPKSIIRSDVGDHIVWQCLARGEPKPTIEWTHKKRSKDILTKSETLSIANLSLDDEGVYECTARNPFGVAAKEVRLIVAGNYDHATEKKTSMVLDENVQVNAIMVTKNMSNYMEMVKTIMRQSDSGRMFTTDAKRHLLTPVQQMIIANYTGCVGGTEAQVIDCSQYEQYRSVTGICNNFRHPYWGSAATPFGRLLPPMYEDNLAKPIGWFSNVTSRYHGHRKPDVLTITKTLLSSGHVTNDPQHNHLLMLFGQFLDHDLTFAAASRSVNLLFENENLDCRHICRAEPCYSIERMTSHRFDATSFTYQEECIEVIRSAELCGTGFTSIVFGRLTPREQVNMLTTFIDGSNIYGSSVELAKYLRELHPDRGMLKTIVFNDETYPPLANENYLMDCQLRPKQDFLECFLAGDHRANEHIGLLVFHTIWLRQHNRIAGALGRMHPEWSGEEIYQLARKLVGAQLQVITYRDWLPFILGKQGMDMMGEYQNYDDQLDPSISNVFATAAMRFGHTLVNKNLMRHFKNVNDTMRLREFFFSSHLLLKKNMVKKIIEGMMTMPLKKPNPEEVINDELTGHLFESSRYAPLDLSSINIQRGRDHALPGYNHWRQYCHLGAAQTFDDLKKEITKGSIRVKLQQLYGHPDNIDLWVGAVLEDSASDAKVGSTFRCLLVEQFRRLRDGDRYFYRNSFTPTQVLELEAGTSLSKIICDNIVGMENILSNAFELKTNQVDVECNRLKDINLNLW